MANLSVKTVINEYKKMVKDLVKDPTPGHKAIVVYGGFMGKTFQTHEALKGKFSDCYHQPSLPYKTIRKNWVHNLIKDSRKGLPVIVLDTYMFPYTELKKSVPEYKELVNSLSTGNFGFTLSKPYKYVDELENETKAIPAGFYEINSNLIFLVGYSVPKDLIDIIPSFNFDFEVKPFLTYIRANVDTIFPELTKLTHEVRLELVDHLLMAYENGQFKKITFGGIRDVFRERGFYEKMKKDGKETRDFDEVLAQVIHELNEA